MKKIQLYVDPDKEKEVFNLIDQIEEEGSDGFTWIEKENGVKEKKYKVKRGYTQDRIKEILRVYYILAKKTGTIEPYDLLDHVLNSSKSQTKVEEKKTSNPKMKNFLDQDFM